MAAPVNALAQRPLNQLAYQSTIGPMPRNEYLGALADFLAGSYSAERTQQMQGISKFLGVPAVSQTLDRLSYGEPLTTGAGGLGGTTRIRPEVLEAALTVAPLAQPVTMASLQAARLARQAALAGGRAGERYAERVVPGIMERGGLGAEMLQGMAQGSRRQIFVGENSKTWNKGNAAKAVEMEKSGAKPEDIWMATGTFRGPEGKLRQEVSDVPSQLLNKQKDYEGKLFQGFSHPELYKNYPALEYYDAAIQSEIALPEHLKKTLVGRGKGSFTEKDFVTGEPKIEAQAFSNEDKSTLLHELQHAVQAKEGFARGGNINEFRSGPMFNPVATDLNADLSKALTGGYSARPEEIMASVKYGDPKEVEGIVNKYGFKNVDDALEFLKNEDIKRTPFGQYQRLAGEAEARAVQKRMSMTPEERMSTFPYESYDVPVNQLIVRTK